MIKPKNNKPVMTNGLAWMIAVTYTTIPAGLLAYFIDAHPATVLATGIVAAIVWAIVIFRPDTPEEEPDGD